MKSALFWLFGCLIVGSTAGLTLTGCGSSMSRSGGPSPYCSADAPSQGAPAIPGALPSPNEEVWVIERAKGAQPPRADDVPGTGALVAKIPSEKASVAVPLKHTDVKASIAGYIATVNVTQQFHNPFDVKIEAVYVFPLPHNAAVNEFIMTVGQRRIRGIIREKAEAQRIYAEAKSQGYVASLLTQERPNVFTQSVANIEPGRQIDINIRYFHTLAYVDGWYEWVFPMVVGPRFNPPGSTTSMAQSRGAGGISGQSTEVQYLHPTERSGHDISLSVAVNAGVEIEKIECPTHSTKSTRGGAGACTVALDPADSIPNRDFVLRYKVAGGTVKSALIAQRQENGDGYFTLMLYPPEQLSRLPRKPLEMVFVIDTSGSQDGEPLRQSKAAVRYALSHMDGRDTMQVVRFSDTVQTLFPKAVAPSDENIREAQKFVDSLNAGGGTTLCDGLRAALEFPHDEEHLRYVVFMTDGFIGNDREALGFLKQSLGPARIFSFGCGNSTNRYLLEHMAKIGNGAVACLGTRDNADEIMQAFMDRISHPAMTDLALDFGGAQVSEIYPAHTPDLFVGRPAIVTGRFKDDLKSVMVKGRAGGETQKLETPATMDATARGIAPVWARMRIADLYDQAVTDPAHDYAAAIRETALNYGLLSAYTAFIAVDASARTAGDYGVTVPVPVPVPDGVRYDTTVKEKPQR